MVESELKQLIPTNAVANDIEHNITFCFYVSELQDQNVSKPLCCTSCPVVSTELCNANDSIKDVNGPK